MNAFNVTIVTYSIVVFIDPKLIITPSDPLVSTENPASRFT